jgi:hypothetical protein
MWPTDVAVTDVHVRCCPDARGVRDTGHKARALCPALCPVSAAPRTLRRSVRAGARAWAPSCPSLLLLWVPGLEYWPLPLLTPHILGGVLGTGVLNFLRHLSLQQLHGAAIPLRHIHRDIASRVVPGPTVWSRALRLPQRYAVLNVELRAPAEVLIPPPA